MSDQHQPPQAAPYVASGKYEYSYQGDNAAHMLQIFSLGAMSSTFHDAQETLDLLRLLQSHEAEIEEAARKQAEAAQKPQRKKTVEERLDDLFS